MQTTRNPVIYLRVIPELFEQAKRRARSQDRTIHEYVRHLIHEDLRKAEKEEGR